MSKLKSLILGFIHNSCSSDISIINWRVYKISKASKILNINYLFFKNL